MRTPPMLRRTNPTEIDMAPDIFLFSCVPDRSRHARRAPSARSVGPVVLPAELSAARFQQPGHRVEQEIGKPGDRQHHAARHLGMRRMRRELVADVTISGDVDDPELGDVTPLRDGFFARGAVGRKWLRSRMVRVDTRQRSFVRAERAPFSQRRSIAHFDGAVSRALTDGPVALSCQTRRQADAANRRCRRRRRNGCRRGLGRRQHRRRYGHALAGSKRQTKRGCQRGDDRSGHGLVRVCAIRFCYRLATHRAARHTVLRDRQCRMAVVRYASSRSTSCERPFGHVSQSMRPRVADPVRSAEDPATCATRLSHRCRARCLPTHRGTTRVSAWARPR